MKLLREILKNLNAQMTVLVAQWIVIKTEYDNLSLKRRLSNSEELTFYDYSRLLPKLSTHIYNIEVARDGLTRHDIYDAYNWIEKQRIMIPKPLYLQLKARATA